MILFHADAALVFQNFSYFYIRRMTFPHKYGILIVCIGYFCAFVWKELFIMNILQAAALGLVQGLAEFLPISSSGHLILARAVMGISTRRPPPAPT